MPNLRRMIDGIGDLRLGIDKPVEQKQFKLRDQVVLRRNVTRTSPRTQEVIVGTITAFAEGNTSAVVTIPRPGGTVTRTTVQLDQLEPVTAAFKRSSTHWNPAFRGQM